MIVASEILCGGLSLAFARYNEMCVQLSLSLRPLTMNLDGVDNTKHHTKP